MRLGISHQVGLVGPGLGEASAATERARVENAGVYSVEGQDDLLQMTLRDINA